MPTMNTLTRSIAVGFACLSATNAIASLAQTTNQAPPWYSYMTYLTDGNTTGTYDYSFPPQGVSDPSGTIHQGISLGQQPTVFVSTSSGYNGISGYANLYYSFGYFSNQVTGPIQILAQMNSKLSTSASTSNPTPDASAVADAQLYITDANNQTIFLGYQCAYTGTSPNTNGCTIEQSPISDTILTINPNEFYTVAMKVNSASNAGFDGTATSSAWLDPLFSFVGIAPSDGQFIFSDGILTSASNVPEPATAALALTGLAALARIRRIHKPS